MQPPFDTEPIAALIGRKLKRVKALFEGQNGTIYQLKDERGKRYILKSGADAAQAVTEARMLEDLKHYGIRVPECYGTHEHFLLLSFIESKPYAAQTRAQMAANEIIKLHSISNEARMYGYYYDTLIGPFWQSNEQTQYNWALFYAKMRLGAMATIAQERGYLSQDAVERIAALGEVLHRLLDLASIVPSLIHGDLWSGNMLFGDEGVYLIDPALYFADREVELAFIELFGALPLHFFDLYREHFGIDESYEAFKRPLYQLYPLLVHVAIYGEGYLAPLFQRLEAVETFARSCGVPVS